MRSLKLLALALLLLPGCILVTDDGHSHVSSKSSLERRVSELEEELADMKATCAKSACDCMSGKAAAAAPAPAANH